MPESQLDVKGMDKIAAYHALEMQLDALLEGITDPIAMMSTIACVLHHGFGHLWTGFYRRVGSSQLLVGPYQGTLGCLTIAYGHGVCGTAAAQQKAIIVPDVSTFPGHITCDSRSRSEIVVPVFDPRGELMAVLDIDSAELATFDTEDQRQLERWMARFAPLG